MDIRPHVSQKGNQNMENGYETFVTDLRQLLLDAMDLEEGKIYFASKGEMYGCTGDRLFVECGPADKTRQVCGLHKSAS